MKILFPMACVQISLFARLVSYPVVYLRDGSAWKAETWSVHLSVFLDNENL